MSKATTPIPMVTLNKLTAALASISRLLTPGERSTLPDAARVGLAQIIARETLVETAEEIARIKGVPLDPAALPPVNHL